MALLVKKEVSQGALKTTGCYIRVNPVGGFGNKVLTVFENIQVSRSMWASKVDYEANITNPTIETLQQIPNAFAVDPNSPPATENKSNVNTNYLYWISKVCKALILAANPTWVDTDVEIVDLT